uniref:Decapping nuclease n=1 Tax=Panagrolaimus sp. JU765 TaxID=591449 RepID=A0AC34RCP5_9BILA
MDSYVRWSGVYSQIDISSRKVGDFCFDEDSGEISIGLENFPKLKDEYDKKETDVYWDLNETFEPDNQLLSDPGDNHEETLRFLLKHAKALGTINLADLVDNSKVVCNRNCIKTIVNGRNWEYFFERFNDILFVRKNNSIKQTVLDEKEKVTLHFGLEFENKLFNKKDADRNWKSKSAVVTKFHTKDGEELKVFYTNQIDGVDINNATIEAKSGQTTEKNIILTQCKLGMVETALFGNCDKGIVTKLRKEQVDGFTVDKRNARKFIEYFVAKMNEILKESSQLLENQILVVSCNDRKITYKIDVKDENNQVLFPEFKEFFQ